jgi:hypothetical protein
MTRRGVAQGGARVHGQPQPRHAPGGLVAMVGCDARQSAGPVETGARLGRTRAIAHLRGLAERRRHFHRACASPCGQLAQRNAAAAVELRGQFKRAYRPVVGKQWRRRDRQLRFECPRRRHPRPFRDAGEGRRQTLSWPRQIPIEGEPADVNAIVLAYAEWLPMSPVPKLFIKGEPGAILSQGKAVEFCRSWAKSERDHRRGHPLPSGRLARCDRRGYRRLAALTWVTPTGTGVQSAGRTNGWIPGGEVPRVGRESVSDTFCIRMRRETSGRQLLVDRLLLLGGFARCRGHCHNLGRWSHTRSDLGHLGESVTPEEFCLCVQHDIATATADENWARGARNRSVLVARSKGRV